MCCWKAFDAVLKKHTLKPVQMRRIKAHAHRVIFLSAALKQLHGSVDCDAEQEEIDKEKSDSAGLEVKNPWELFADRSQRWQLLTVILLNAVQQLNGINAVC